MARGRLLQQGEPQEEVGEAQAQEDTAAGGGESGVTRAGKEARPQQGKAEDAYGQPGEGGKGEPPQQQGAQRQSGRVGQKAEAFKEVPAGQGHEGPVEEAAYRVNGGDKQKDRPGAARRGAAGFSLHGATRAPEQAGADDVPGGGDGQRCPGRGGEAESAGEVKLAEDVGPRRGKDEKGDPILTPREGQGPGEHGGGGGQSSGGGEEEPRRQGHQEGRREEEGRCRGAQ
ncbi:hypothetical protein [Neomoorella glycerini]|uniref:hypothetical protein n=1 Tax=Neomoorella glycerini TaxID=55779 RepID=UPI0012E14239|nr:hypothetical protein [Moorella glycerini]